MFARSLGESGSRTSPLTPVSRPDVPRRCGRTARRPRCQRRRCQVSGALDIVCTSDGASSRRVARMRPRFGAQRRRRAARLAPRDRLARGAEAQRCAAAHNPPHARHVTQNNSHP